MAAKPLVAVFGATGAQGGAVAQALLSSGRWRVRGITRNPESASSIKLKDAGAELAKADVESREDLLKAFEGAHGAFLVTDFWSLLDREYAVAKTAVEVAKEAGVKHLVWSSLPNTAAQSGGEINVPHFVSKAKVEEVVKSAGFEYYTFPMCGLYFQNFSNPYLHFTSKGEGDEVLFTLPMKADDYITGCDVTDIGPVTLAALENPSEWNGKHISLAGFHGKASEYAEIFEKVKGRKVVFKEIPPANEELGVMFRWFSTKTYFGDYDRETGRQCFPGLKTWEQWLKSTPWSGP